jgi:hypothetical protein
MTRRLLTVACCALVCAMPVFAQSKGAKTDPLTGTWTGELNPSNAPGPVSVTAELRFDGKSAVSGTVTGLPRPAEVKAGTFNPKTGALKLDLGKKGEPGVLIILEGTVVKGKVSGRLSGDEGGGTFTLAKKP